MWIKIFKYTVNTILVLLVMLGIFVVFSFVPFPGNYKIFVVESGSMEPAIHTGSLIFVKPETNYKVGDIITRKTNNSKITITHRIVKKEKQEGKIIFDTKGDANNAPDEANFSQDDIIGQEKVAIPWLGYPVNYAKTTQGLILLIIIPAVVIIYDEMQKIKKEILKKIDYRKRVKKRTKDGEEKREENLTEVSSDDIQKPKV